MIKSSTFLWIGLFILLVLNYQTNFLHLVSNNWFNNWQQDSEALVIKSLREAKNNGLFYNYGLMGTYIQQIGLQGIFLRIVNALLPFEYHTIFIFRLTFVLFFCILAFYLIYWTKKEFGRTAAISLYIGLLFNRWLIVSVRNLYWASFTLLFPFVIMVLLCEKDASKSKKTGLKSFLGVSFLTIFIKSACGYEMISSIMISLEIPMFYYAIKENWGKRIFLKRFVISSVGAISAFASAMGINLIQQALYYTSYRQALYNIIYTISKRTGVFNIDVAPVYQKSLEASKISVLKTYFTQGEPLLGNMRITVIALVLLIVSALCFLDRQYSLTINVNRKKLLSLTISMWISFCAPLSWYILASPHSYIHTTINYILWSYPFLLMGFILFGSVLSALFNDRKKQIKKLSKITIPIVFVIVSYFYQDACKTGVNYLNTVKKEGIPVTGGEASDVLYYNGNIYYIIKNGHQYKKIFLHIYPQEISKIENGSNAEFKNSDFYFRDYELRTPIWSAQKIARVPLETKFEIEKIHTGQFDETGREWEIVFYPKDIVKCPDFIVPYQLSDEKWNNGILNDGKQILLKADNQAYWLLDGKQLKSKSGVILDIKDIKVEQDWIHLLLDKCVDAEDGYPNPFEVISD